MRGARNSTILLVEKNANDGAELAMRAFEKSADDAPLEQRQSELSRVRA